MKRLRIHTYTYEILVQAITSCWMHYLLITLKVKANTHTKGVKYVQS